MDIREIGYKVMAGSILAQDVRKGWKFMSVVVKVTDILIVKIFPAVMGTQISLLFSIISTTRLYFKVVVSSPIIT